MTTGSDLDDRIRLLSRAWLFSGCSEHELERVASLTSPRTARAGDELTREGDAGAEFFVVIAGNAVARVEDDPVGDLGPGSFFGEMALIDGGERMATVTATTDMELLVLDRDRPLELSLRRAPGSSVAGRRGPVNLRVERVRVRGETNGA